MANFITYPVPAPTGGLNLIDRLEAPEGRPQEDARQLKNIYPAGPICELRKGMSLHLTLEDVPVRSMFNLPLADGTETIIACHNSKIEDVTSNPETDVTGSTTPTSDDWQGAVFKSRLFMCNGADTVQVWNGSTVIDSTFTGITLSLLINVSSFKNRLYFVEKDSTSIWYGNTNAVGASALTEEDFESALTKGGYVVFAGSWTNNVGDVSRNLFCVVSSEGEVLFYNGSYPGDATTPWGLVARFFIGKPLGYNAFVEVDNDLWILTQAGIYPVSLLFSGGSTVALNGVGRKINPLIRQYAASIPFSHLWYGRYWAAGKRVYISIPITGSTALYAVCNIETGAWCTYEYTSDFPLSMTFLEGQPYIGSDTGIVFEKEVSYSDGGSAIEFDMKLPFNFYGARQQYKVFKEIRPLIRSKRGASFSLGVQTDFQDTETLGIINSTLASFTAWGSAWGSDWSSPTQYIYEWVGVRGQGHSAAIRVAGSMTDAPLEFSHFDVRFELGGQR